MLAQGIDKLIGFLFGRTTDNKNDSGTSNSIAVSQPHWFVAAILGAVLITASTTVLADGSETLGPPSIAIAEGTGIVSGGTGMVGLTSSTIELEIPAGATVKQVLVYWEGLSAGLKDPQIRFFDDGERYSVRGTRIGGPDLFFSPYYSTTYRADVTNLVADNTGVPFVLEPGSNTLTVRGLNKFDFANNGIGFMVIIDDGSGATELFIRDGDDVAWIDWPAPRKETMLQTFTFDAAAVDRTANISMFFAAVAGPVSGNGPLRPTTIEVTSGGSVQEFNNLLGGFDGPEWDLLVIQANVPAGATTLTVQALSEDREGTGENPASFVWLAAGVTIPPGTPLLAALGDRVWEDLNENGIQDCSDTSGDGVLGNTGDTGAECDEGISGVTVKLLLPGDNGVCGDDDDVLAPAPNMTTTDGDGFYRFNGLEAGDYCVAWQKPDGYECTTPNVGDNAADSDGVDMGNGMCSSTELASLFPGDTDLTWDLGLVPEPELAALGDRVWEDLNSDGAQNCTDSNGDGVLGNTGDTGPECDTGIADVTVKLQSPIDGECGIGNPVIDTTTTDSEGFYRFSGLDAGDYCVAWQKPDGYECTTPNILDNNANVVDSDGIDLGNGMCASDELISLDPGETDLTWDLGLVPVILPAALGDRVWHDLDNDGLQDCTDDSGDGILGNTGDTGDECGAGIPDVQVDLFYFSDTGCDVATGMQTFTDADGFYLFEELDASQDYCVMFGLPPADFCNVNDIQLGDPMFTTANAGNDVADSDVVDADTGKTGLIDLLPGQTDRSNDAGVVCPVKIGDFVWEDDGDGIQQPTELPIAGVAVELFDCGPDMIAGTDDDFSTEQMRTTGSDGMYMFGGEPADGQDPGYSLDPGKYFVVFDPLSYPDGYSRTLMGQGGNDALDSDCGPPNGLTQCTDLTGSGAINLDRDCGLMPPPPNCDLVLDKTCRVEPPPPQDFDKCDGKLTQFTLIWTGAGPITASGPNNTEVVDTDGEATFFGPFDNNDVFVNISGAESGQSVFHVSCSDEFFNDPSDCGLFAGDGKGDDSSKINKWRLEGFIDSQGRVLDCSPSSDGEFADNCSFSLPPAPSCETTGDPDTLTWSFDGGTAGNGTCFPSTFADVQSDFECFGSVNAGLTISVVDDEGVSYSVEPGAEFTMERNGAKEITLSNSGGTQTIALHTSCSQPIEAGRTAGALTLVALDNNRAGADVTYQYQVTNNGDALTGLTVFDNLLGNVGGPINLGTGGMDTFYKSTRIMGTTVNTATASGMLNGEVCSPDSASDTVTVEAVEASCDVSISLEKIEDRKIKWRLTNPSGVDATIDNVTLTFPGLTKLQKIKFDGSEILKDVRLPSPASVSSGQWLKEVKDRTLEAGEDDKRLEFAFSRDFPLEKNQPLSDFSLIVNFEQGCSVTVN